MVEAFHLAGLLRRLNLVAQAGFEPASPAYEAGKEPGSSTAQYWYQGDRLMRSIRRPTDPENGAPRRYRTDVSSIPQTRSTFELEEQLVVPENFEISTIPV